MFLTFLLIGKSKLRFPNNHLQNLKPTNGSRYKNLVVLFVNLFQLLGYGWAGIFRKYLVDSPYMWWPANLVQVSLFRCCQHSLSLSLSFNNLVACNWQISTHKKTSKHILHWYSLTGDTFFFTVDFAGHCTTKKKGQREDVLGCNFSSWCSYAALLTIFFRPIFSHQSLLFLLFV